MSPKSQVITTYRITVLLASLLFLSACGGGGGGGGSSAAPQEPAPTSSEVNSNAIKGPLKNTEITLTDAGDVVIDSFTGSGASFVIDLPPSTNFPVTVTTSGGVDSILGNDVSEQSIVLKSVIFSADQTVVNLNPFTTLLVDTAIAKGGLTQANLDAAVSGLGPYSFGLPEDFNPVTSAMTDDNTPDLLMSFETLFEVFRRVSRATGKTPNEVIAAVAADLSDDLIDGAGSEGVDSVSTALFNTNTADVLLEALSGILVLDSGGTNEKPLSASDLNTATGLITGNAANLERAGLQATERTKSQTVAALNVALRSADNADKDALGKAVNFVQTLDPQNPPPEEEAATVRTAAKSSLQNVATKNTDPESASSSNQNASQVFSNPDNNLPLAVDDLIGVPVGSGTSIVNPLANDTGLGDTPITLVIVSTGPGGSVTLNEDNTFSFTPDTGFFGFVDVAYEVTDADDETTSATASLFVDDLPAVQNFNIETAVGADANINVFAVTTGTGNAPVTFTVTSAPANGTLTGSGGVFVYSPNAGFAGADSASVTVEDADGDIAVSSITIFVDDQPVAVDDDVSTPLGTPISANPLDNDTGLGNTPVTLTLGAVSSGGTAVLNGTTIDFEPTAGFGGSVTMGYTVTDADGDSDTGTLTILVDDIPVANGDSAQTTVGIPVTIAVLGNDSGLGNSPVSLAASDPAQGSTSVSGANIVYTPDAGFTGDDSFTYTVTDADGDQDSAVVSIFVDALPAAVNDTVDTQRDAAILIAPTSNDNLGNTPTALLITSNPTNGTAVVVGSNIQYTPNLGFGGLDTIGYQIIDVDGDQSTATISVNVDDFPVLVDQNLETPLNTLLAIDLLSGAVGLADTPIVLAVTVTPTDGVLVVTGTTATYTPNAGFAATDSFQYTATDSNGDVDTATISVLANDTPAAGDDLGLQTPVAVALNNINVLANDVQLGNVPIVVTVDPASLVGGTTVVNGDNTINFTPAAGFGGQASFQYTVTDNDTDSATASVQVFVEDIPAAVMDSVDTPVNTAINIDVLANDTGKLNTPLAVTVTSAPGGGSTAVQPDNTITYTPNPTTVNTDNFDYTLADSDGDTSVATVAVYMDDQPVAVDDTAGGLTTEVATLLNIDVLANDTGTGNSPLTFSATPSGNATVNPKGDSTLDYTPNVGFAGSDSFTYSFTDSDGDNSGSASVNVFVNDTPMAVADSAGTAIDTPVVIDVLSNDTGKLNGITGLIVTVAPTIGTVDSINVGAGTVRYNPNNPGVSYNDAFTYEITDTDGQTATALVNVGVGFAATSDTLNVVENISDTDRILGTAVRTIDPLANDALGPDGMLDSIDTTGTLGTVAINGSMIDYTPPVGVFGGSDSFQYTISSVIFGTTSTTTVTINTVSMCTLPQVRCIGAGEEYTGSQTDMQMAFDDSVPGDWVKIKAGTYQHPISDIGAPKVFLHLTNSGTAGNPIRIEPFDGEIVTLQGWRTTINGWLDCTVITRDGNGVVTSVSPLTCDDNPAETDQVVLLVDGDYVEFRNLKIVDSTEVNVEINGSYGVYENLEISDGFSHGIFMGRNATGIIEGNKLSLLELHHNRHGSGINSSNSFGLNFLYNNTFEGILAYLNGFQSDNQQVPPVPGDPAGGGNSDGFTIGKFCEDEKAGLMPLERSGIPQITLCPDNTAKEIVAYRNADDGIDVSWGDSSMTDSIAFDNGPEGNRGFKVLRSVAGLEYVGNISMEQLIGYEVRGKENLIFVNNLAVHAVDIGIFSGKGVTAAAVDLNNSADFAAKNNLTAFGASTSFFAGGSPQLPDDTNNWTESADGDPMVVNSSLTTATMNLTLPAGTIRERLDFIINQFKDAYKPDSGSPLVNAGVVVPGVHCPTADDSGTPPGPGDEPCRHWLGTNPDIGAFELE